MGDAVQELPPPLLELPALALTSSAALASWGLPRENHAHSKPSGAWKNVVLFAPAFLQDLGGFSSFSWAPDPGCL
jgi:hypothetical protein